MTAVVVLVVLVAAAGSATGAHLLIDGPAGPWVRPAVVVGLLGLAVVMGLVLGLSAAALM